MSIRGIDARTLARLKREAARQGVSLNSLVVRLLQGEPALPAHRPLLRKFADLDELAGTWSEQQLKEFENDTAPFAEVDPQLWK